MPPPMAPADSHLHQHHHRKHQRHAGERIGAELADEIGLDQSHRGLRQHHQDIGGGEADQGRRDRAFDQRTGTRVVTRRFGCRGLGGGGRVAHRDIGNRHERTAHWLAPPVSPEASSLNGSAYRSIYAYIMRTP
ncbi:MAG TPA: hypothetical protein VGH47_11850 [Xanthobacteraceae bacterium]